MIQLRDLWAKYSMQVTGVMHVGAHLAEEAHDYADLGVPVWWVEANTDVAPQIAANIVQYENQLVIWALVADVDGEDRMFHVTNYDGMSSSVFQFDRHPIYSPDTVFVDHRVLRTFTLDTIVEQVGIEANMLNLDIQGAELLALRGATKLLPRIDYIYTEVSTASVYAGGVQMQELDEFLADFERVETDLFMHGGSHGDALYLRRSHV